MWLRIQTLQLGCWEPEFSLEWFCSVNYTFQFLWGKFNFIAPFPLRNHLLLVTLWQSSDRNPGLCNGGWADKSEGGEEILVGWSYQEVIGVRTLDKEIAWGKLLAWHGRYSCMKQPYPGRTLFICVYPLPTPNHSVWACGCSIKNCGSCWVLWHRTFGMG